jgi:hypothetical protein
LLRVELKNSPKKGSAVLKGTFQEKQKTGCMLNKRGLFGHPCPEQVLSVEPEGLSAKLRRQRRKQQRERNHCRIPLSRPSFPQTDKI